MQQDEIARLRYRRQYLVSPVDVVCPFLHKSYDLGSGHTLYAHPDLNVTDHADNGIRIILLGDMFDYINPEWNNREILSDLIDDRYDAFLKKSDRYTGRYVLIYQNDTQFNVVTDPTAARKVFYSQREEGIWMASQSHLLAAMLGLGVTTRKSEAAYYASEDFLRLDRAGIGNRTHYDEVTQLMPNHFLSVFESSETRFWPREEIIEKPLQDAAMKSAEIVKGYMESISYRYKVMLPVTGGNDTRLLLAGTRSVSDRFYYYINKEREYTDKTTDVSIPARLLPRLNLKFHIEKLPEEIPEDFKKVYYDNNPFGSEKYLPHIYNYYKNHSDRVNLPGNFASAPWGFNRLPEKNASPETLAYIYKLSAYEHAIQYNAKWLEEAWPLCKKYGLAVVKLFYWEERIGNWGTQTQLDKDIAQEDYNPFNSRLLVTLFFSVKSTYNNFPDYKLHKKTIRILWPELLSAPINPTRRNKTLLILKYLGLFKLYFKLFYKTARNRMNLPDSSV